jgi:ABC-type glutathione transport system ATPase component
VLIADEPSSALDVTTQKMVIKMLKGLMENGFIKCMIFITHELPLLYNVTDDIMVMYAGQIVEKASAKEAVFDPLHPLCQRPHGLDHCARKRPAGCQTDGHSRGAAQPESPAGRLPLCRTLQVRSGGV